MQPTAVITHPQKLEASVTVELPRKAVRMSLDQARERATTRAVAVVESDGVTHVFNAKGEVQSLVMNYPPSIQTINDELKVWVKGISNVPRLDGSVVTTTDPKEIAKEIDDGLLWDDHLEVSITAAHAAEIIGLKVPEGEIAERPVEFAFARYVSLLCGNKSTFDKDAEGNASRSS